MILMRNSLVQMVCQLHKSNINKCLQLKRDNTWMASMVKKSTTTPINSKSNSQRRTPSKTRFKRSLRFALRKMHSSVIQSSPLRTYLFITIPKILQIIHLICHLSSGVDLTRFAQRVKNPRCSLMELLPVISSRVFLVTVGSSVHC